MLQTLNYFKALSDETRLRILLILWRYELHVNEIVNILNMGQSRISRHLKILSDAGLLVSRRDGLWVFYSTVSSGDGKKFIEATLPFLLEAPQAQADLALAGSVIEERSIYTRQFFNSIAADWDNMSREILGDIKLENKIAAFIPDNCSVAVDLGCGTGSLLEHLLHKSQRVIGVDGSARMLELARRRFHSCLTEVSDGINPIKTADNEDNPIHDNNARISLRIGDLEHLPLGNKEVDFVSINLVLHHLSAPAQVLNEVSRVLTNSGLFVLSEFDQHNDERMRTDYGDRWLGFSEQQISQFMDQAGMRILDCQDFPVKRNLTLKIFKATKI